MANKGRSERGLFGSINHYDENGKKIGHSDPGLFGGYTNYDERGKKIGHSDPGLFGGYNHYDSHGRKTGSSSPGFFGSYQNYDKNGKRTGSSDPGLFGSYNHNTDQGCYIATCVYGSYDCPQVWTLRRFRDGFLAKSILGRAFIRIYYATSPTLVKIFGKSDWFKNLWHAFLNPFVKLLNHKGIKNTPYKDKNWI